MYSAVRSSKGESVPPSTAPRQDAVKKSPPSTKPDLFGRQNEDLNKLYKSFHQEYVILAEYKMVHTENIPGVYVIPSRESPLVWFGIIFVRSGPYEDGIFRFNIILGESFPDCEHPKVVFTSELIHPVISSDTNELYLLDAFPVWNKTEQHIWQVLKYIHWIFNNFTSSILHGVNKELVDLYKNHQDAFNKRVKQLVKSSQENIYQEAPVEDKHYLLFEQYNPEVHEQAKTAMLTPVMDVEHKTGYSWVFPGIYKPLGRPSSPEFESES